MRRNVDSCDVDTIVVYRSFSLDHTEGIRSWVRSAQDRGWIDKTAAAEAANAQAKMSVLLIDHPKPTDSAALLEWQREPKVKALINANEEYAKLNPSAYYPPHFPTDSSCLLYLSRAFALKRGALFHALSEGVWPNALTPAPVMPQVEHADDASADDKKRATDDAKAKFEKETAAWNDAQNVAANPDAEKLFWKLYDAGDEYKDAGDDGRRGQASSKTMMAKGFENLTIGFQTPYSGKEHMMAKVKSIAT